MDMLTPANWWVCLSDRDDPDFAPSHPQWCDQSACIGFAHDFWRHGGPVLCVGQPDELGGGEMLLRIVADEFEDDAEDYPDEPIARNVEVFVSVDGTEPASSDDLIQLTPDEAENWRRALIGLATQARTA